MDAITDAVFSSWDFNLYLLTPAFVIGLVYTVGWIQLHKHAPRRFGTSRLASFYAGVLTILVALISPLDAFSGWLLTVHMIQHLLLMMVAPPLILYGAPYLPLLFGLPRSFLSDGIGPFLRTATINKIGRFLAHPAVCLSIFVFTNTLWHVPVMYELALHSSGWHHFEHWCFLLTALLFWWPIIRPFPWTSKVPRWTMIPYLFLADLQNTALSAYLVFGERILYPTYESVPRITGLTAMEDQAAAGAIMWVAGSIFFLIPVGLITIEVLSARRVTIPGSDKSIEPPKIVARSMKESRGSIWSSHLDLLALPYVGAILRWKHFRRAAQSLVFLATLAIVVDGLLGPQMGAMNLAGVLPWTYWRGITIVALLAVGNIFCMACPFQFVRDIGRRILPARWPWPRRLRSKWIAITLLLVFFWAYEGFDLWDNPRWTAILIIGYFGAALVVDGLFKGASFCKYVCPIGQYQFIQSLLSPVEVTIRNPNVCSDCKTHDCIRGNEHQRGCELQLFQPRKATNLDCTFCLDCVHACPHNNVSLFGHLPARQLIQIEKRRRAPKWSRRFDGAVVILLLVFAAFVNAGSMLESVQMWEQSVKTSLGLNTMQPIIAVLYLMTLVTIPVALTVLCVWLTRLLGGQNTTWRETVTTFAPAFVPLGLSMWLVHFGYHLVSGLPTAIPVIQRAAADVGAAIFGAPDWPLSSYMITFDWLPSLQILVLDVGLLFTLYIGWRLAARFRLSFGRTFGLIVPWAALGFALYFAGVWILSQPMQMRGMMMGGMH